MEGYLYKNHQINHLLEVISVEYDVFLPQKKDGKVVFSLLNKLSDAKLFTETIIPFKKILFPNRQTKNHQFDKKIAIIGLHNCDAQALNLIYQQFSKSDLLIPKTQLLLIGTSCTPNDDCFCDVFGADKIGDVDFYLQKEKEDISAFLLNAKAKKYFDKAGLKNSGRKVVYRQPEIKSDITGDELNELISNRKLFKDFWQGIANNCFGCGACTAVCPLCFCFRQDYKNGLAGNETECLNWDSCFAKEFSEVQNHFDLRSGNVDRLYNWYHHKFVRAICELGKPLCVGCGRCIKACPAHLNIKNILRSLEEQSG